MTLDAPTLLLATSLVTAMVGSLFLLSWSQDRRTGALFIWGVAHLVGAVASGLFALRGQIPGTLSIALANALMIGAYGAIWNGLRAFEGRRLLPVPVLAAVAVWTVACLVPVFYASLPARVVLASVCAGAFCALSAAEVWRGRGEPLVSRYPAAILLAVYAAVYALRVMLALFMPMVQGRNTLQTPWLAAVCLVSMLFTVAVAFTFMALTKERAERKQRLAAETDGLTGVATRRAFVAATQALLADESRPVTVLLFDLDHFKRVNDSHGHAVGDGVLVGFCCLVREMAPPGMLLGRLGGEEFACALPGASLAQALVLAGRIRVAVGRLRVPALPELAIGVSVGIAGSAAWGRDFDALLRRADSALYRAKRNGRNRVEVSDRASGRAA